MKAIELKNVSFSYEGYEEKVLNDASLSVDYGELSLLSGFSGEVKSTVLSLIDGIIPNINSCVFFTKCKRSGLCCKMQKHRSSSRLWRMKSHSAAKILLSRVKRLQTV